MKNKKIIICATLIITIAILGLNLFLIKRKNYSIRINIPAGSSEGFVFSDEELSPRNNKLTITSGDNLGDCEVVLKAIEEKEENVYEPTYLTHGMPVKMDVEKGAWFKVGVNMQNLTDEDIDVYVNVSNVELRIE